MTSKAPETVMETFYGAVGIPFTRFDGAEWQRFETDEAILTLTSLGRSLWQDRAARLSLQVYFNEVRAKREGGDSMRQFIAEGGNARVFAVGDSKLAVKEKRPGSSDKLLPSLERMDFLTYAIEACCPRWVATPKTYG